MQYIRFSQLFSREWPCSQQKNIPQHACCCCVTISFMAANKVQETVRLSNKQGKISSPLVAVTHQNDRRQRCSATTAFCHERPRFWFFVSHTSTFQLLDNPWSQVSSLLPLGSCLQLLSRIGFSNATSRRFFIECC